jgi:hypothetical protein
VDTKHSRIFVQEKNPDTLTVSFPYNPETVEKIKTIQERKWNKNKKHWELPNNADTFSLLKKHFYSRLALDVSPYIKKIEKELTIRNYSQNTIKNYTASVKSFFNYQKSFPSKYDEKTIRNFSLYLKNRKKLATRTINLR